MKDSVEGMVCDTDRLETILFEILKKESGWAGIPLTIVESKMNERALKIGMDCDETAIRDILRITKEHSFVEIYRKISCQTSSRIFLARVTKKAAEII
jgi:hypothetical protein